MIQKRKGERMDSLVRSVLGEMDSKKIKKVACFKSRQEYFLKERSGVKPNTQRKIDDADERFDLLRKGEIDFIEIKCIETGEIFIREITDVSIYDGWMTISWRHSR